MTQSFAPCETPRRADPPALANGRVRRMRTLIDDGSIGQIALILGVIGLIWLAIFVHLREQRDIAERHAEANAANFARMFADNVTHTMETIDRTLHMIRQAYARNPQGFDLGQWTHGRALPNSITSQIGIIDRQGRLITSNLALPTPIDLSDREHFRVHADGTDDRLFVSKPVLGRLSNRYSLQFTRRIDAPEGRFLGVVVISLSTDELSRFYSSIDIGQGFVVLAGLDGIIRALGPHQNMVGRRVRDDLLDAATNQGSGHLRLTEPQGQGFTAIRRMPGTSLFVAVALDARDVFANAHADQRQSLLIGTIATAAVLAFGGFLLVHRRRVVRSQQALSVTLENMAQGIIMVDVHRRVRVINHRAVTLLGLPDRLTKPGTSFDAIRAWQVEMGELAASPDDAIADIRPLIIADLKQRAPRFERVRPDGRVLEIRTELLGDGGAVRTYTDITERKRAEQDLARARDAAEAASHARTNFLAVMSHEIRTPLNGVIGAAELILSSKLDKTERIYAEIIQNSGNHLLALINDILDFSRLDAVGVELETIPFDLPTTIRGAIDVFAMQARDKNIQLRCDIGDDIPDHVSGDPARLRQVLFNLLGNAVKFTNRGNVQVNVRGTAIGENAVRIALSVTDTGIGIPANALDKLFQEFTQADSSVSRRFGGSGLGLAICRRLVEMMGGTIHVTSTEGVGSTFGFEIVLNRADPPAITAPSPSHATDQPLDILLAEDNDTNRLIALHMLRRLGHTVETVPDGRQAVTMAEHRKFDVIIMDVMMPEMDGLVATRAIRALPGPAAQIPIIGLTAGASVIDEMTCRAAGMTGFALKPITIDGLRAVLAQDITVRTARPAPSGNPDLLNHAALTELRNELGEAILEEILELFLDQARSYLRALQDSFAADAPAVRAQAHLIVGAARNIGLLRLGQAALDIERSCQHGIPDIAVLTPLATILDESIMALQTFMAGMTKTVRSAA